MISKVIELLILMAGLSTFSPYLFAASTNPIDTIDDVEFTPPSFYAYGPVLIAEPIEGMYTFQTPSTNKNQPNIPAVFLGKLNKQQHVIFTAEQQEQLWKFRQKLIREASAVTPKPSKHKYIRKAKPALKWPRTVVNGNEICVPELLYSEQADWKEHLTCTSIGGF